MNENIDLNFSIKIKNRCFLVYRHISFRSNLVSWQLAYLIKNNTIGGIENTADIIDMDIKEYIE